MKEHDLIKVLKCINRIPFRVTAKIYSASPRKLNLEVLFSSSVGWDAMYMEHPNYRISANRETWLKEMEAKKDGQDSGLRVRAKDIASLLIKKNIKNVHSIGSGGGVLEYHLKKIVPGIKITASDFAPETVKRLRGVFIECDDVVVFDALDSLAWKKVTSDSLVLFYRIEREFSTQEWRRIFSYMHDSGVEKVLIVVPLYLTLLGYFLSVVRNARYVLSGTSLSFVGYWRSKKSFEYLFRQLYSSEEVTIGTWQSFFLERIDK